MQTKQMESGNSLMEALINQYPARNEQIISIFQKHHDTANRFLSSDSHREDSTETYIFPLFSQLTEKLKQILGISEFRSFMDSYIKSPEHNQKIKEEMSRLEKEVLTIEAKEQDKFETLGLAMPKEPNQAQLFCYSSLSKEIEEEFKEAKWIVLTSPSLAKPNQKSPMIQSRDPFQGSSNNGINLQLTAATSNSNQNQSSNHLKLQNQPPQKRYGHSASLVKNKMYIFGGLASHQKGGNLQTFYECQLKFNNDNSGVLFQWDKIKSDTPRARDSHTCIHVGDALIMFGGSGGISSFNDLFKFDLRQQKWSKLEPAGDYPAPREGHIAKLVGRDRMLIHGGVDQKETSFDDTYILTGISQFMDSTQQTSILQPSELKSSTPFSAQLFETQIQVGSYDTNSTMPNASVMKPHASGKLRWYRCIQQGIIPQGRDSHSSAQINNKIYIFGGQGDGDVIFDDLYSVEIIEEVKSDGEVQFIAQWEQIEPQTPKGQRPIYKKPCARTSHTCTVYKNRFLIIIGGEAEIDPLEVKNKTQGSTMSKKTPKSKHKFDDISVEIEQESASDQEVDKSLKANSDQIDNEEIYSHSTKKPLNDVWIYDTLMHKWHEIKAPFKIQGSLTGKKIKREFEPRMAHSAVQLNQFVIIFGGLSTDSQLVSNDLYVLCLDGCLGGLSSALDQLSEQKKQIQVPEVHVFERTQSAPNSKLKPSKTLKITNPSDRKIMSGQILNQIINFNNNQTNQFFLNGNQLLNNSNASVSSNNIFTSNMNQADYFNGQRMVIKNDCQVQTVDFEKEIHNREQAQKQQVIMILKQNEYKMKNFQRTKVSFIKTMSQEITWPLQCFSAFIDNSIQAFEQSKIKQEQAKLQQQSNPYTNYSSFSSSNRLSNLEIDINMRSRHNHASVGIQQESAPSFNSDSYLEIKDNGPGIHPKQLMEALTSFGSSNLLKFKSDQNLSEHGIALKLNSLRLASNILIITKTKPIIEYGCATSFLSIALLSLNFLKDSGSTYMVAPLVSLEVKNKRISKNLTPQTDHFLNIIAQYTRAKFANAEALQSYSVNVMGDHGTHFFLFDLQKQKTEKKAEYSPEIGSTFNDIILNPSIFDFKHGQLEQSLRTYLKFLYVEYPDYIKINLNGHEVDLKNPYSLLKKEHPAAFIGEKTEKFAVQLLDEQLLEKDFQNSNVKVEDENNNQNNTQSMQIDIDGKQWFESLLGLQGILIYRGNRLIRRLETCFGEDEDGLINQQMKELSNGRIEGSNQRGLVFKKNAIISVFKSRSVTSLDKKDFSEKNIMKRIKEWFKERELNNNV